MTLTPYASNIVWLKRWHALLAGAVITVAIALAFVWSSRALILLPFVALAFTPFSWARLRLERDIAEHLSAPRILWAITIVGAIIDAWMIAQLLTARSMPGLQFLHGPLVSWIGPIWFSTFALLAIVHGVFLAGRLLARTVRRRLARAEETAPNLDAVADPGRRQFLRQASVLGAGAPFAASVSGASVSYDFRVDEHDVALPDWPLALDGFRIAHLSDIHVGGAMDLPRLLRVAELTNRAEPDLVVHTGDFLTHRPGEFDLPLYEALSRIQAPHGQWACLGNHDFDDVSRLVRKLGESGVRTLRNEVVRLEVNGEAFEVAGLDYAFNRMTWPERYAGIIEAWGRREVPRILLNHDPTAFRSLPERAADLVCSGHTHGGQVGIQLGYESAVTVVGLLGVPDQGIFHRDGMQLFVTRCVGFYGYPMRIGIPPEISLLRLRRA